MAPSRGRKCSCATVSGAPCRAWAVRDSDPPACAAHSSGAAHMPSPSLTAEPDLDPGVDRPAPATCHGDAAGATSVDIQAVIADLAAKQQALSRYIDECLASGGTAVQDMARLLALHSQNAARLGRLLRDKQALLGSAGDDWNQVISQALDELATEWGLSL
jgi:hypothetical protein